MVRYTGVQFDGGVFHLPESLATNRKDEMNVSWAYFRNNDNSARVLLPLYHWWWTC